MKKIFFIFLISYGVASANEIYIDQSVGNNNSVSIEQRSANNQVTNNSEYPYSIISGDNNTINITQGNISDAGVNTVEFTIMGNGNNFSVNQGQHWSNNQASRMINQNIVGNHNSSVILQYGNSTKTVYSNIIGDHNTQHIEQEGSGEHFLDVNLTGNHNFLEVDQEGNFAASATVNLHNVGGPSSLSLYQNSESANQPISYGVTQFCADPNGCSVTVTQAH